MRNIKRTVASAVVSASMTINLLPAVGLADAVDSETEPAPAVEAASDTEGSEGQQAEGQTKQDGDTQQGGNAESDDEGSATDEPDGTQSDDEQGDQDAIVDPGSESNKDATENTDPEDGTASGEPENGAGAQPPADESEKNATDDGGTGNDAGSDSNAGSNIDTGTDTEDEGDAAIDIYDIGCGAYTPVTYGTGRIIKGYVEVAYNVTSSLPDSDYYLNRSNYRLAGWQDADGNALEGDPTGAGSYRMVLEGCGSYYGTLVTEPVELCVLTDISDPAWSFVYTAPSLSHGVLSDLDFQILHHTNIESTIYLTLGEDFAVTWADADGVPLEGDPTLPGTYTAILTGQGSFTGTRSVTLTLNDEYDFSSSMYDDRAGSSIGYAAGDTIIKEPQIYFASLQRDEDFTVTWYDAEGNELVDGPHTVGFYTAVLTGIGEYHGTRSTQVEIRDGYDISNTMYNVASVNGSVTADGVVTAPVVSLRLSSNYNQIALEEGVGYHITWYDADGNELDHTPNEPGTFTMRMEGIAPYYGERTGSVRVYDFSDVSVILAPAVRIHPSLANGQFTMCTFIPAYDGALDGFTDNDYVATWFDASGTKLEGNPTTTGTYSVRIDGIGKYHGSRTLRVTVFDALDISSYSWSFETEDGLRGTMGNQAIVKNGALITPLGDLNYNVPSDCYAVTWFDEEGNELPGDPTVPGSYRYRIDGVNGWCGSVSGTARVYDYYDITHCDVQLTVYADEDGVHVMRCDLARSTFTGGNYHFVYRPEGSAVVVGWSDMNGNPLDPASVTSGLYKATVEGQGEFYGTLTVNINVLEPNNISCFSYEINSPAYISADGTFTEPSITLYRIKNGERTELDPACYTIYGWSGTSTGSAPTEAGIYSLALVGTNGYVGSLRLSIEVIEGDAPVEPTDPAEPNEPNEPAEPGEPTEPVEPENPAEPVEPGSPDDPTDPPTDPSNPGDPEDPVEPPVEPDNPEQGEPEEPMEPPTEPAEPGNPDEPTNPEEPSDPVDPTDPTEPAEPSEPEPGTGDGEDTGEIEGEGGAEGEDAGDENPDAEGETPGEQPGQPGQPETPDQPAQPEQPGDAPSGTPDDEGSGQQPGSQQPSQPEQQPASLARTADDTTSPIAAALAGAMAVLAGACALVRRAFGGRSER